MHITLTESGSQIHARTYSLHGFSHSRSYLFAKTKPCELAKLSSLMAPFSDLAATLILLTVSALTATLLLIMEAKHCYGMDLTETALMTFSGLIRKSWNSSNGNSKFLLLYTAWLFLVGFILMTYTNILQSIVVFPGIRFNSPIFQEMLRQNYTFESWAAEYVKLFASRLAAQSSELEKEVLLRKLVVETSEGPSWIATMDMFNEASKRVAFALVDVGRKYEVAAETVGWVMVAGQERFFNRPSIWSFQFAGSGSLLKDPVEMLKQIGFVTYFCQLCADQLSQSFIRHMYWDVRAANIM